MAAAKANCVFFAKKQCLKGDTCEFLHDPKALAKVPLCGRYKHDPASCKFGLKCRLIHGEWCSTCKMYAWHPWNADAQSSESACDIRSRIRPEHVAQCTGIATESTASPDQLVPNAAAQQGECSICYENIAEAERRFGLLSELVFL
jgi:hypothetical protein